MNCRINQIMAELRRQMNGAVSQTMRELGHDDYINLGVSLPTIKEIAQRYAIDHELACELGQRKMREARIAALYIADAELLTVEQTEQWSSGWRNEEIARLSAVILFYRSPIATSLIDRWLDCGNPLKRISALYIVGKVCGRLDRGLIKRTLSVVSNDSATIFALREIYFNREEFRTEIEELAQNLDDLRWQIELK